MHSKGDPEVMLVFPKPDEQSMQLFVGVAQVWQSFVDGVASGAPLEDDADPLDELKKAQGPIHKNFTDAAAHFQAMRNGVQWHARQGLNDNLTMQTAIDVLTAEDRSFIEAELPKLQEVLAITRDTLKTAKNAIHDIEMQRAIAMYSAQMSLEYET